MLRSLYSAFHQPFTVTGGLGSGEGDAGEEMGMEETAVSIVDFAFEPAELTIPVGTTVVWTNEGDQSHTVTAE